MAKNDFLEKEVELCKENEVKLLRLLKSKVLHSELCAGNILGYFHLLFDLKWLARKSASLASVLTF